MNNKQVVYQTLLPVEIDGVGFDIFDMKYPDYTMIIISEYGQLLVK